MGEMPTAFPIQAEATLATNCGQEREMGGNLFRAERQSSRPANGRRSHRMGERPDYKNRKRIETPPPSPVGSRVPPSLQIIGNNYLKQLAFGARARGLAAASQFALRAHPT